MSTASSTRRLIEVAFPLGQVSEAAQRERYVRSGGLASLHTYWARKPLSACRAALLSTLLPDPVDPSCPESFLRDAPPLLAPAGAGRGRLLDRQALRQALVAFVAEFAAPEAARPGHQLETARRLVRAAGTDGELTIDPFAGGGSIPLEALRLGVPAWAGDLNPVADSMLRSLLEDLPRHGEELAEELGRQAAWVMDRLREELAPFYPTSSKSERIFAYRWYRTARCEGPGCGADVPLMSQPWLAQRRQEVALRLVPGRSPRTINFELVRGRSPTRLPTTIQRGNLACPLCGFTTPVARLRAQARERRLPLRLAAVVTVGADGTKDYRLPVRTDLEAVAAATAELQRRREEPRGPGGICIVPDEPLPPQGTLGFRVRNYGFETWGELFQDRQLLALTTLVRLVREVADRLTQAGRDRTFVRGLVTLLGFLVDRTADYDSSFCRWLSGQESASNTFARTAFPMLWDPVEINPLTHPSADWRETGSRMAVVARDVGALGLTPAVVVQASATRSPLPDHAARIAFTDPPYYDAIPYGDLSDFFHVWLRRSIGFVHPDIFVTPTTPKEDEIVVNQGWRKDRAWFEAAMSRAFAETRRVLDAEGIAVVVFAHRSTEGWEALLGALLNAGWTVTASWPVRTEMASRLRALNSATLESSIHLVCRPRSGKRVGDWREVQAEVGPRVREWLGRLTEAGIWGADALFACLGPALEVFSRHERVERASGVIVPLREFLQVVWSAVAREALSMIFTGADATGLEADARVTAMWLWTLRMQPGRAPERLEETEAAEETDEDGGDEEEVSASPRASAARGFALPFDAALRIAQSLGARLEELSTVVVIDAHQARLLGAQERARSLFEKLERRRTDESGRRGRRGGQQEELFVPLEDVATAASAAAPTPAASTLDRVHQAMLVFAAGQSDVLRRFLNDDRVGKDTRFWALAQSLAALYPEGSDERRWVLGVLARRRSQAS